MVLEHRDIDGEVHGAHEDSQEEEDYAENCQCFEADSYQGYRAHNDTPWEINMLFFSYFKDLVGRKVTVKLKNDLAIRGTLHSVDQYFNIKLENARVVDEDRYPHMRLVRSYFIRRLVVRYVQLPPDGVDVELLHDAVRREAWGG